MTEPVARATSPRRTVRVAVALVTGQAILCAVIGWVTFGPTDPAPQAARPADPVSEPFNVPTTSLALPALPPMPAASTPGPGRSARPSPSPPPPVKAPATPSRRPAKPPAGKPAPVSTPDQTLLDPTAPPPDPALQTPGPVASPVNTVPGPVVEDTPCEVEGDKGITVGGVELSCGRKADGSLVWLIN